MADTLRQWRGPFSTSGRSLGWDAGRASLPVPGPPLVLADRLRGCLQKPAVRRDGTGQGWTRCIRLRHGSVPFQAARIPNLRHSGESGNPGSGAERIDHLIRSPVLIGQHIDLPVSFLRKSALRTRQFTTSAHKMKSRVLRIR